MNVVRPRCLLCSFSNFARFTSVFPHVPRRQFHPSYTRLDRKPKDLKAKFPEYKSIDEIREELTPSHFERYTEEQKARLAKVYSPEQIAAIEAAEEAIDPKDLAEQFGVRRDPMKFNYLDDFSVIEPVVDHHIRPPKENTDYNSRLKEEEELDEDIWKFIQDLPDNATNADLVRFVENTRMSVGKEDNERNPHMAILPDIFERGENLHKDLSPDGTPVEEAKSALRAEDNEELTPDLIRVLQSTGWSLDKIRSLKTKTLVQHGVVNQTRLGKIRRYYCLSVAGNGSGLLGIGEAKSEEPIDAAIQSRYRAIRNMQPVLRYENRTIFGDVTGKVGAVELRLMNRPPGIYIIPSIVLLLRLLCYCADTRWPPGFGLRCQHLIYEMCRAAGIHDMAARVERSRNPMNTVKAAYEALMSQKDPEDIARARGKKLVDVRKVYYAGRV